MITKQREAESFYIKLNSAFAFIFILVVVASGFGIYTLYSLGQVINTTEKETFPATLAAMRLSERTALIAATAPALTAASSEDEIKDIYFEFENHMAENRSDLEGVYKMGDPHTLIAVKESLDRVSAIEASLRKMVAEKLELHKNRDQILDALLKLQADLDDTLGPLMWGTTSLTRLLGKRKVRIVMRNLGQDVIDVEQVKTSLDQFAEAALKPLQTALDIKAESSLLMSLLNMAMHVSSPDDTFPLENRASRSLNLFLVASREFDKGELSKRNPILDVNLNRIEENFTNLIKEHLNPFEIRRKELEKEVLILSLLNQGRQEARTLSQEVERIVGQVQVNLHNQAKLVSRRKFTGVTVLMLISMISCLLSTLVAILTNRTLRNRDTTIQQAVVEAERANRIKSQFLANMSHEIRTPMNSVLGFLELVLENGSLAQEQRQQLFTAHSSAQGLLSLINDILDMNKLESGKVLIEHEQFSLPRLVQQIFQVMVIKANEKHIDLNYHIHDSLHSVFSGDPLRIRQIIINLVGNAIKFTHTGGVILKIMSEEYSINSDNADTMLSINKDKTDNALITVHFIIEDTGIGIPPERLEYIFQPFTQADSSTTRKYGGTGLGTTISKQLVELMGGNIWIESKEGKGSAFHFTIPLIKVDEPLTGPSCYLTNSMSANSRNSRRFTNLLYKRNGCTAPSCKILVAEDVEANALLVMTRLKLQGHITIHVTNGIEAVRAFQEDKFDIILMDIHMPEMDGVEATKRIRGIEMETGGHIPIIALTASVMKDEIKMFLEAGVDSFVAKPIDFNELANILNTYILHNDNNILQESSPTTDLASIQENSEKLIQSKTEAQLKFPETGVTEDINLKAAIERWQDISLYMASLNSFSYRYGEVTSEISALINGNSNPDQPDQNQPNEADIEEAYKITHSLKGVAANLSLIKVAESAEKLGLALLNCKRSNFKKAEDGNMTLDLQDAKNCLTDLSTVLKSALKAIDIQLRESDSYIYASDQNQSCDKKEANAENRAFKDRNKDEIESIFNDLDVCINQYSPDGVETLIDRLEQHIPPEYLIFLRQYVEDFEFSAAGKELVKLVTRLKDEEDKQDG